MSCAKSFSIEVEEAPPPFDCEGNTTDVASLNWSQFPTGSVTGTVAYPNGTFDFPLSLSSTRNIQYLPLTPNFRFCNPTIGRIFTATIAGNFLVSGASTGRITIRINHNEGSVFTSSQSLDFNAAGPFSIQTSIPFLEALAVNTIRFTVTLQEFTGSVGATGTLTTTDSDP